MRPEERFICRFAAEPPQGPLPYGRWAETLQAEFLDACLRIDAEGKDLGEAGEISWFPDRSWGGRTYVPATARSGEGYELYGYVSFTPGDEHEEPHDFFAWADYSENLAEDNPDWTMDLTDEAIGGWRGEQGNVAAMTLVWGRPLVHGGTVVTAELARLAVDQCHVEDDRFTLLAPDDYRGDYLEVALYDAKGSQLARESLYEDDDEAE
jgi:hypothetical protein